MYIYTKPYDGMLTTKAGSAVPERDSSVANY